MTDLQAVDEAVDRSVVINDPEDRAAYIRETVLTDLTDVRTVVREIEAGTYPMIPVVVAAKIRRLETTVALATSTWPQTIEPAPAPYTEPRDGDEVEVAAKPKRGVVALHRGQPYVKVEGGGSIPISDFVAAVAEGRVRLVQAAAPTYEPGVYWSPSLDRNLLYAPDLSKSPWVDMFDGSRIPATDVPADLVPCDVVPREATT